MKNKKFILGLFTGIIIAAISIFFQNVLAEHKSIVIPPCTERIISVHGLDYTLKCTTWKDKDIALSSTAYCLGGVISLDSLNKISVNPQTRKAVNGYAFYFIHKTNTGPLEIVLKGVDIDYLTNPAKPSAADAGTGFVYQTGLCPDLCTSNFLMLK